jgi:hypothetical protein
MALCFVAFEYGAEGLEDLVEYTDQVLEKYNLLRKNESVKNESEQ